MAKFLRDNGMTLALVGLFVFSLVGMILSGRLTYNEELARQGQAIVGIRAYIGTGNFLSALFENWESEFLQMAIYVLLTATLFQRRSAESRDPDNPDRPNDEVPSDIRPRWLAWLYAHSLGTALVVLFIASFLLHWRYSLKNANMEALLEGEGPQSLFTYLLDAGFWFESFQNWQSEFMATAVLIILSIFLRQQGSTESKPTRASNRQTGEG